MRNGIRPSQPKGAAAVAATAAAAAAAFLLMLAAFPLIWSGVYLLRALGNALALAGIAILAALLIKAVMSLAGRISGCKAAQEDRIRPKPSRLDR